jgi:hypothetical protein
VRQFKRSLSVSSAARGKYNINCKASVFLLLWTRKWSENKRPSNPHAPYSLYFLQPPYQLGASLFTFENYMFSQRKTKLILHNEVVTNLPHALCKKKRERRRMNYGIFSLWRVEIKKKLFPLSLNLNSAINALQSD